MPLKTFISYKWEGEAHNSWVERFAGDLRAAGIDAQLDKWEIRFGDSLTEYMTSRIDEADVILCIVTDEYVKHVEAPEGQGGATKFEMQMAVSRRTAGDKVRLIGIYRQGSRPPNYLRDHLYVDFRDDSQYANRLQQLVDDLRGKSKRPPLGQSEQKDGEDSENGQRASLKHHVSSVIVPGIITNSIGMQFRTIEPGAFRMGESGSQHPVTLTEPFRLDIYPVTQAEYKRVMDTNPSKFKGERRNPVERVSWFHAITFCNRLSEQEGLKPYYDIQGEVNALGGEGYRLPTEAEWEYACRAGSQEAYCFGDDETLLPNYAWFDENSGDRPHPAGEKEPNAWGLYDMHGNVWEWCWDWYGQSEDGLRVHRGGSWGLDARSCRSAYRDGQAPGQVEHSVGFRVARSFVQEQEQPVMPDISFPREHTHLPDRDVIQFPAVVDGEQVVRSISIEALIRRSGRRVTPNTFEDDFLSLRPRIEEWERKRILAERTSDN